MAAEYAQFKDFRIRDCFSAILKQMDADLEEIGFEPSPKTLKAVEELETLITDIETEHAPKPAPLGLDDPDTSFVRTLPKQHIVEDADIEESIRRATKPVNVDDELEEFIQETSQPKKK